MRIAIVTNANGIGLQVEAELLKRFVEARGHEGTIVQYDQPPDDHFDLAIWLEVVTEAAGKLSDRALYFANPEWLLPSYIRPIRAHFDHVLAKTRDAERRLRVEFANCEYTGFLTRDKLDASVPRLRRFLHIGGNSGFRNTQAIISAWREYRYWDERELGELVIVSNSNTVECPETPGVTFIRRASDEEIKRLQNECLFHLYPSAYEGFGHALHEAFSVGAEVLTTDAPPMNEFGARWLAPTVGAKKRNLGELYEVSPVAIRDTALRMMEVETSDTRSLFETSNESFARLFEPFLAPPAKSTTKTSSQARLALWGNHRAPYSTENDLVWTLERMGYGVVRFQEDQARTEEILHDCRSRGVELLIWVHTHGWSNPGDIPATELIYRLRAEGIKTCSFHLDRYWGLNKLDSREDLIGVHPWWKTDRVFTADGGNDERFRGRGINHHWLPPGTVCEHSPGRYQEELAADVGFVGAESYHPEYPFRGELIAFLKEVYRDRFWVYQGYRGAALNDLYASIKVIVGDSCFAGVPRYWSDRVPETLGRGGFLIHPAVEGLRIPGLVTFEPGDLQGLRDAVDFYLDRPDDRKALSSAAKAWVLANESYTNRMRELLGVMGVK